MPPLWVLLSVSPGGGRTQEDICGFWLKEDAILGEVRFVHGRVCYWSAPSLSLRLRPHGTILRSAQWDRFWDLFLKKIIISINTLNPQIQSNNI
jgi:hypothetical protein